MKELLSRLASRPGIAAELLAASLLVNTLALASPLFVIQVLNRYVAYGVDATLQTLTVGVVLAVTLEFAFRQVRHRLAAGIAVKRDQALTDTAFATLSGTPLSDLDRVPADLRPELLAGTERVQAAYNAPNLVAVLDVPFALLFVAVLALLSPVSRELAEAAARRGALVASASHGADTVRAFNARPFLSAIWQRQERLAENLRRRVAARHGLAQSFSQAAGGLMSVAVIAVGATLVVQGRMDVGAMIGANILASRALGPVMRFAQLTEALARARQSLEFLERFTALPMEKREGAALAQYKGGLEFKDLAFAFPLGSGPLFEGLNLKLLPGCILVVTGGNGAGKTTLARLVAGLLEPTRGAILVDGVDLRQVVPEWWRKQVIYLPQEPTFLNASIRDNLATLDPDLDDQAFNAVVEKAGLRRFIDESPGGADMMVTDQGGSLSLGIRRRLALARGLTSRGRLAVFDEPTEGLDAQGAAAVYGVMNELARAGHTILAFSHDPNIIKGAQAMLDLGVKPVPRFFDLRRERPDVAPQEKPGAS